MPERYEEQGFGPADRTAPGSKPVNSARGGMRLLSPLHRLTDLREHEAFACSVCTMQPLSVGFSCCLLAARR